MQITMMNRHEPGYSAMLNDLTQEVFGFSFAPWQETGMWDERYESYSVIEDGRMLSNICVFKAELLIAGKQVSAYQLGAVATRKDSRGRGLSRALMEHVIGRYPDVPLFLFANQSVLGFYPRFGFRRAAQWRLTLEAGDPGWAGEDGERGRDAGAGVDATRGGNPMNEGNVATYTAMGKGNASVPAAHKIPPTGARVMQALASRGARSAVLDTLNTDSVAVFHLLMDYPEDVYDLPGLGAVAVARQEGDLLSLADVIAPRPLPFEAVMGALPFKGVERVEFGFCPDWLGVTPRVEAAQDEDTTLFLRGGWALADGFVFPVMAQT